MSESDTGQQTRLENIYDEAKVARINCYIRATGDFVQAMIDDPDLFERVPDGAQLVFDDDPALSAANLEAAARYERDGVTFYVHRVAADSPYAQPFPAAE